MPGEWEHAACGINHPTNAGGDDEQEQREKLGQLSRKDLEALD